MGDPRFNDRYKVVRAGLRWGIQVGTGTAIYGRFWRKITAERVAALMLTAFRDGEFIGENRALV